MKILAVDDENGALELLVSEIKKVCEDVEIDTFLLPEEALAAFANKDYQVAFLDIEMPQMSGVQLAKQLKQNNEMLNIIFVTAYREYGVDAMNLHASGYLLKPVSGADIRKELDNLRYPIDNGKEGARALTFGSFDFMYNGNSVSFGRSKSKELLAYLIDRHGQGVSKREAAAVLFEDKPYSKNIQDYVSKIVGDLHDSLKAVGAEKVLRKKHNYLAVDTSRFTCDLYEYEKGLPSAINAFHGEYMSQYSWAEESYGCFYGLEK